MKELPSQGIFATEDFIEIPGMEK